jgi:16S rRNA (cytosine967-C5)-methyltransferase
MMKMVVMIDMNRPSIVNQSSLHQGILTRKQHLYKLWNRFLQQPTLPQFDKWVSVEFKNHPQFGSKDRRFYCEILFAFLRYAPIVPLLTYLKASGKPLSEQGIITWINIHQKSSLNHHSIQWFSDLPFEELWISSLFRYAQSRNDNSLLDSLNSLVHGETPVLFKHLQDLSRIIQSTQNGCLLALWNGFPVWYLDQLQSRESLSQWNSSQKVSFLEQLNHRPPLWVRLNFSEDISLVSQSLVEDGFEMMGGSEDASNGTFAVSGAKGIYTSQMFKGGKLEIQDLASQCIGRHVVAKPGESVWDACAGGGGKTMQLASVLKNKGLIYASDIREYKLDEVKKRARRAGFFNIRTLVWDGEKLPEFPKEIKIRNGFDWVLIDAPCSSSGTWRRNPDAKYRELSQGLEGLQTLQHSLLLVASDAVKPGGSLVYSTCSFFVEENESVVNRFVKEKPNFKLVSQKLVGSPELDADTMFVAVLQNQNDSP